MSDTQVISDIPSASVNLDVNDDDEFRITESGETRIYEDDEVELVDK